MASISKRVMTRKKETGTAYTGTLTGIYNSKTLFLLIPPPSIDNGIYL
jgi:hypothetical protein